MAAISVLLHLSSILLAVYWVRIGYSPAKIFASVVHYRVGFPHSPFNACSTRGITNFPERPDGAVRERDIEGGAWETNSMMQDTREDVYPTLPAIRAVNTYPWILGIQPKSFVRVQLCGL